MDVLEIRNAQLSSYKTTKKTRNLHFEHFLPVHAQKSPTRSDKNMFFETAYHYPTTLVIHDNPKKLKENELFVIKN